MTSREEEVLNSVVRILKETICPSRILLFGSRAKGKSLKGSDFDIAVDVPRPQTSMEREMNDEIEKVSGLYSVDIVYLDETDEEFKSIINNTGRVIYYV